VRVVLVALLAALATAPDAAAGDVWRHLVTTPRLLDDPGGARSRLEELGLTLQLFFQTFLGHYEGATRNSGSYDGFVLADLEALGLVPGATVLLHYKGNYGRNVNPKVNALSDPIDDADFDAPLWVASLWLEQAILSERVRLRLGYIDQQVVFDRNAFANSEDRQFMSTFLDNNPLVPLRIGLGADLILTPTPWLDLALGTADADNAPRRSGWDTAFDGAGSLMGYAEATARARLGGPFGGLPGSYRVGVVYDNARRTAFGSDDSSRGHFSVYLNLDQLLFREEGEQTQGLGIFARWGRADPDVSRIRTFWSGGLHYEGLLPTRDRDVLGLGFYGAVGSKRYRSRVDPDFEGETGMELYYKIILTPWLHVTPDVQLILDPGGDAASRDALVLALRLRVAF
jgi:porin